MAILHADPPSTGRRDVSSLLADGWTAPAPNRRVHLSRTGDLVELTFRLTRGSGATSSILVLPAGFRPPADRHFPTGSLGTSQSIWLQVAASGDITFTGTPASLDVHAVFRVFTPMPATWPGVAVS